MDKGYSPTVAEHDEQIRYGEDKAKVKAEH